MTITKTGKSAIDRVEDQDAVGGERCGERGAGLGHGVASELVAAEPRLDAEEVDRDADQDDQEHRGGDRRAHVRVAELELEAEEGAVEEGAEDVGGEVRAGERALG